EIDFKGSPWLAVGPFATDEKSAQTALEEIIAANEIRESATSDRYERIWDNGMIDEDIMRAPFTRLLGPDMYTDVDVSAITTSDRPTDAEKISTRNETAMLCNNEEWTTIHPPDTEADVRLLLDFGDELVGYHEFEVDAPDGTIIDNQNFEFIQRDGRYNLAEGMNNSFRYVCREGVQRYRTFVRRGFRYSWLVLRNFNRPVRIRFVKAISSTYPMTGEGNFDSSDTVLGQLWDVGAHTLECCAEDTYTDCPTYEQTHWVGDARHEALIDLVANGDPRLSKHCWLQAARSLDRSPMVESHVPSGWSCILTAWSLLWMRWAQEHFMLTGDKELAQNMLRYIERNVCGIEQHINEDNLLEINAWNMLDWADMDTPDNGIVTHQNCLTVVGLRQAAELALHVGQKGRAQRWNALADRVSYAIDEHLWAEDNRAYIDCIHPNGTRSEVLSEQTQCMAYLANLPSDTRRQRCLDVVLDPPDGFVSAGSPFYMFFALESMAQSGHYTTLLDTIREYWTPQLEAGATTFWEAFWADRDRKTRSHCHAWSAAPTYFLPREILGIKPCTPGYDTVLIAPHPCDLAWAHGRVPTPHGTVECAWENRENTFNMNLRMPDGIEGRVQLPYEGTLDVERGDAHTTSSPDNEIHLECKGPGITICLRDKHPKRHSE
ncbi:MAG: family 78 glycoside hydrolase catalytic domain, partial [Planctomycetota bacterium]